MEKIKKCIIVTSINEQNDILEKLSNIADLIIVGDLKTTNNYKNCIYLDINKQKEYFPDIADLISYNHYSRKNFGYLYAIKNGYDLIYDTDDDNLPLFNEISIPIFNKEIYSEEKLMNIYQHYSNDFIWSRGYPLDRIHEKKTITETTITEKVPDLIYGLCDGDTDLDAVCRITNKNKNIKFIGDSVCINKYNNIIFNSQSTFWLNKNYFKFLYLPTSINSRFSDILRSYVMQYCSDAIIGVQSNVAYQIRNPHNLIKDMKDELFMYESIDKVIKIGEEFKNLTIIDFYKKLYDNNIISKIDLEILEYWELFINKNINKII